MVWGLASATFFLVLFAKLPPYVYIIAVHVTNIFITTCEARNEVTRVEV